MSHNFKPTTGAAKNFDQFPLVSVHVKFKFREDSG